MPQVARSAPSRSWAVILVRSQVGPNELWAPVEPLIHPKPASREGREVGAGARMGRVAMGSVLPPGAHSGTCHRGSGCPTPPPIVGSCPGPKPDGGSGGIGARDEAGSHGETDGSRGSAPGSGQRGALADPSNLRRSRPAWGEDPCPVRAGIRSRRSPRRCRPGLRPSSSAAMTPRPWHRPATWPGGGLLTLAAALTGCKRLTRVTT